MGDYEHVSIDTAPWAEYTRDEYDAELDAATIRIRVTTLRDRTLIASSLKHSYNRMGRVLCKDFLTFGLRAGDRLEPCLTLPDVAEFDSQAVPFDSMFFRCSKNSRIIHPSPILEIRGAWTHVVGIDLLHTWHLGPLASYIGSVFWHLIEAKVLCKYIPFWGQQKIATSYCSH